MALLYLVSSPDSPRERVWYFTAEQFVLLSQLESLGTRLYYTLAGRTISTPIAQLIFNTYFPDTSPCMGSSLFTMPDRSLRPLEGCLLGCHSNHQLAVSNNNTRHGSFSTHSEWPSNTITPEFALDNNPALNIRTQGKCRDINMLHRCQALTSFVTNSY